MRSNPNPNPNRERPFDRTAFPGRPWGINEAPPHPLPSNAIELHGVQPRLGPEFLQPCPAVHPDLLQCLYQNLPARAHQLQSCRTNEAIANLMETLSKDETQALASAASELHRRRSPAAYQLAPLLLFSSEWCAKAWNDCWPLLLLHWPAELEDLEVSCVSGWRLVDPEGDPLLAHIADFVLDRYDRMEPWSTPGDVQKKTTDESVGEADRAQPEMASFMAALSQIDPRSTDKVLSDLKAKHNFDEAIDYILRLEEPAIHSVRDLALRFAGTPASMVFMAAFLAAGAEPGAEAKDLEKNVREHWPACLGTLRSRASEKPKHQAPPTRPAQVDPPTSSENTAGPVENALVQAVLRADPRGTYLKALQGYLEGFEGAEASDMLVTFVVNTEPALGCAVFEDIAEAHAATNKPLARLAVAIALLTRRKFGQYVARLTELIPESWPGRLGERFAAECAACCDYWMQAAATIKMGDAVSRMRNPHAPPPGSQAFQRAMEITRMSAVAYQGPQLIRTSVNHRIQKSLMGRFELSSNTRNDDAAQQPKRQRVLVPQHGTRAAQSSALLAELRFDAQLQKFLADATSVEDMVKRGRAMRPGDKPEGGWSNFARAMAEYALTLHYRGKRDVAYELATLFLFTTVNPGPCGKLLLEVILAGKPCHPSFAPCMSECLTLMNERRNQDPAMTEFAEGVIRLYGR